ncbi:MAG: hypothetical protein AB8G05_17320 [Oligoflexales bacterium]
MVCLMLFLPLFGAVISNIINHKFVNTSFYFFLCLLASASFLTSILAYIDLFRQGHQELILASITWIKIGSINIPFELIFNQLSSIMCIVVTGLGTLVFFYTIFVKKDINALYLRFFSLVNLLVFTLLIAVLANSMPALLISWQGVFFCSFILSNHYFSNKYLFLRNSRICQLLELSTRPFVYLSSLSLKMDKLGINRLINSISHLISASSGVTSFSMEGSIQRHASSMILGFVVLLVLAFAI